MPKWNLIVNFLLINGGHKGLHNYCNGEPKIQWTVCLAKGPVNKVALSEHERKTKWTKKFSEACFLAKQKVSFGDCSACIWKTVYSVICMLSVSPICWQCYWRILYPYKFSVKFFYQSLGQRILSIYFKVDFL